MAEAEAPELETLTLGEFAKQQRIDSALLRLLAEGGHIEAISSRRGSYRFPADYALTAEDAETKGREAYDQCLETAGRLVMKTQSRLRRLMEEIEQQQNHLGEVVPLDPGLTSYTGYVFHNADDDLDRELTRVVHRLAAWNEVLRALDQLRRYEAEHVVDAEAFTHTSLSWDGQMTVANRTSHQDSPLRARLRAQRLPLADELPDGVDDLSPEARRTVLDLLRVLVVAEAGGTGR